MKFANSAILTFLFTLTSIAHAGGSVDGNTAKALAAALRTAGAAEDCSAGTCEIEAKRIQCLLKGNSVAKPRYECSLEVLEEAGSFSPASLAGGNAKSLYNALQAARLSPDCGAGTCLIEAKAIQVRVRGNSVGQRVYEAEITE